VHFRGQRRVARPQTSVMPGIGQMHRQCRSPPTSPENRNVTNMSSYARCPILRSVPATTRAKFAR
jgi:hypothetical protein